MFAFFARNISGSGKYYQCQLNVLLKIVYSFFMMGSNLMFLKEQSHEKVCEIMT
jgi:hypothetical protein